MDEQIQPFWLINYFIAQPKMEKIVQLKQNKNAFFSDDEDGADVEEQEVHPLINLQKEALREKPTSLQPDTEEI